MTMTNIRTQRLVLRPLHSGDLPNWDQFFLSARARHVGGGEQATEELSWRVFATFLGHRALRGTGPFAIETVADASVIGMTGPWHPRGWPYPELTWSLWSARHEGKGYAREAVLAMRRHVRDDLGWERVVSYVDPDNQRSIRLCHALGCVEDPGLPVPDDDPTLTFVHPT